MPDGRALLLFGEHAPIGELPDFVPAPPPTTEVRYDELRGEHVLYAAARQDRTFLPEAASCPLCPSVPGAPATEIPVAAFEIAVFENRFPSLASPHGAAEVVVYTDDHDGSFAALPRMRARLLLDVWRHRHEELSERADVRYVMAFENRGVEVGTTLHHPHGQIYAYPFVPPVIARERDADARLGGCATCALLRGAPAERVLVSDARGVTAYVPHAARWPYEVHVAPTDHRAWLGDCGDGELDALASALQAVTRAYDALFGRPFPYVMVVHQPGHLHVELYPPLRSADRLKHLAGSELGAGTFAVDVLPERAADALREAIARDG